MEPNPKLFYFFSNHLINEICHNKIKLNEIKINKTKENKLSCRL